jgi:hypothetical protein
VSTFSIAEKQGSQALRSREVPRHGAVTAALLRRASRQQPKVTEEVRLVEVPRFERQIDGGRAFGFTESGEDGIESHDASVDFRADAQMAHEGALQLSPRDAEVRGDIVDASLAARADDHRDCARGGRGARIGLRVLGEPRRCGIETSTRRSRVQESMVEIATCASAEERGQRNFPVCGFGQILPEEGRKTRRAKTQPDREHACATFHDPGSRQSARQKDARLPPPSCIDPARERVSEVHDDFGTAIGHDALGHAGRSGRPHRPNAFDERGEVRWNGALEVPHASEVALHEGADPRGERGARDAMAIGKVRRSELRHVFSSAPTAHQVVRRRERRLVVRVTKKTIDEAMLSPGAAPSNVAPGGDGPCRGGVPTTCSREARR